MTVDDIITKITEAPDEESAKAIINAAPHRVLMRVADQLYIETEGRGTSWIRRAVVKEARS